MRVRSVLVTAAATAALALVPLTAHAAKPTRSALELQSYDPAAVISTGGYHFGGTAYNSPFTGPSTSTVTALDGTLPAANTCEPATISVQAGPSSTEYLSITATGEVCASFFGNAWVASAGFDRKDVAYVGTEHDRVRAEGLVSASVGNILPTSGQMGITGSLVW
jgi:hypothetical protein